MFGVGALKIAQQEQAARALIEKQEAERKAALALPHKGEAYYVNGTAHKTPRLAAESWIRHNCVEDRYSGFGDPRRYEIRANVILDNKDDIMALFGWLTAQEDEDGIS